MTHITLQTLQAHAEAGWLRSQRHPSLPLTIWNYSPSCQYQSHWNEVTLACRGLVTDDEGNVVARPVSKFFNFQEPESQAIDFNQPFEVFTKLDGCLAVVFWYNGQWVFASRGSFTSEHSERIAHIFETQHSEAMQFMDRSLTYCFELLDPEFRIVVDYGSQSRVILLAAFDTQTGDEVFDICDQLRSLLYVVDRHEGLSGSTMEMLHGLNVQGQEGFVVRFADGSRCKVKFSDYCELHRVITNLTARTVWTSLQENQGVLSDAFLGMIPDEYYEWVRALADSLVSQYQETVYRHTMRVRYLRQLHSDQRTFAMAVLESEGYVSGWLFSIDRGQNISDAVWASLDPGHVRPSLGGIR
jgi:RNA ligase